ncbi:hypothetical protein GF380_05245 [Candidatus Uhrbacteria bacterium]|nr:hypothetical protein [Candidatus Uhrbacteria bacterium]MBD3284437.1 hypothetical protein [Candidatus Uhrbacteria bacterium]
MSTIAKAIVMRGDKLLALQRPTGSAQGIWDLPGGGSYEDPNRELATDVLNQTGQHITVKNLAASIDLNLESTGNPAHRCDFYETENVFSDVRMSSDFTGYRWVSVEELKTLDPLDPFVATYIH